jgi:hypothetical protein
MGAGGKEVKVIGIVEMALSGLGQAGRASSVIGRKGAWATTTAPERGQEPSRVCQNVRRLGPHHRASRGPNEGVTDVY